MRAAGWEGIEVIRALAGLPTSHAPPDLVFDIILSILGGAAGAWIADRYLDRVFNC